MCSMVRSLWCQRLERRLLARVRLANKAKHFIAVSAGESGVTFCDSLFSGVHRFDIATLKAISGVVLIEAVWEIFVKRDISDTM